MGDVPAGGATVAVPVPMVGRGVGALEVSGREVGEPTACGVGGSLGMLLASTTGSEGGVTRGSEGMAPGMAGVPVGVFKLSKPGTRVSSGFLASAKCRRYRRIQSQSQRNCRMGEGRAAYLIRADLWPLRLRGLPLGTGPRSRSSGGSSTP